jgi:hypothetical protein
MTDETNTPTRPVIGKLSADAPATTGETVCVGCRLPNGLILRVFEWVDDVEASPLGIRSVRVSREIPGSRFVINGWRESAHVNPNQYDRIAQDFPNMFAITSGVPKDLWDKWFEQNCNTPLVENGQVFSTPTAHDANIEAKTRTGIRAGLEPLDPDRPELSVPTRPHRNRVGGVSAPATADLT